MLHLCQDLNIGVAYKYKESTYPDDFLGVQNTKTHELETYGDYLIGHIVKVNAYFDVQNTREYLVDFNGSLANVGSTHCTNTPIYVEHETERQYI